MATETSIETAMTSAANDASEKDWGGNWYTRAMERLVDVAQDLSHARDLDTIMAIVRVAARELTGADGATFVLRDGSNCFYADENAISPLWKGKRFPMSICISGWVMMNAQPVLINDIYADSRIPADAYRPTFVKSMAMVPIRARNPIGAIGNYWARHRTPNQKEIAVLAALANFTALAMENADLYVQLQNKVQDLEKSNAELERFAWVASHDLKSPLRAVDNLAGWIEEDIGQSGSDSAKVNLGKLRQRTRRMEHMLDDLLEYALIDDHAMQEAPVVISGKMMMAEIGELLSFPDGFRVATTPEFDSIQTQRLPLQRVLMNLIGNAIKHHDKKTGHIRIDAQKGVGETVFSVSDDGPGIPLQFQSKVFEMFKTLKPRDQSEGSGMGLSLVKKIVTARGGEIKIRNNEPRGSVFIFTWPSALPLKGLNFVS